MGYSNIRPLSETKEFTFNDGTKFQAIFNGEKDNKAQFIFDENTGEDDRYCDLTFHTFANSGDVVSVNRRVWQEGQPLPPYTFDMSLITSSNANVEVQFGVQNTAGNFVNIAWNMQGESGYSGTNYVNTWTNGVTEHNYNVTIGHSNFGEHVFFANPSNNTANITSANIQSNMPLINLAYAFYNCRNLASFESGALNVSNLAHTFYYCYNLTSLEPLANWNTAKVTSLAHTFYYCYNLTSLEPLANWNTASVTTLQSTFSYCSNLTTLEPLANWNTESVTSMYATFSYCYNLTNISAINNWSNAMSANCTNTFRYCNSLQGGVEIHFNITCAANMFANRSGETFNIYASTKTNAYNALYRAMGNSTNNTRWNVNLYELAE